MAYMDAVKNPGRYCLKSVRRQALLQEPMLIYCKLNLKKVKQKMNQDTNFFIQPLQWRHNERDGVSNHRRLYCLLKRLFRRRPKKSSKLRVTGLCEGNPPVTGGFP